MERRVLKILTIIVDISTSFSSATFYFMYLEAPLPSECGLIQGLSRGQKGAALGVLGRKSHSHW